MKQLVLHAESTSNALWEYYERAQAGFNALWRQVYAGSIPPILQLLSKSEIEDAFQQMRAELDREVTLALTASFEASIRIDFWERANRRIKGSVSVKMRALYKQHGHKVPLDSILEVWAHQSGKVSVVGELRHLFKFRHWLAHGRYWVQKSGKVPDPVEALQIGDAFFATVPDLRR